MVSLFLAYFTVVCIYCRKTLLEKNANAEFITSLFPHFVTF